MGDLEREVELLRRSQEIYSESLSISMEIVSILVEDRKNLRAEVERLKAENQHVIDTKLKIWDRNLRLADAVELYKRMDPALREKYCWGNGCADTDWGGKGRRHIRGDTCTRIEDSPVTRPDDSRLEVK